MPQYAMAHFGIELGGIAEGARSFVVIERVHQRQALVEIALRQGIGSGDGMMQLAKSNQKRRGIGILLLHCGRAEQARHTRIETRSPLLISAFCNSTRDRRVAGRSGSLPLPAPAVFLQLFELTANHGVGRIQFERLFEIRYG